MNYSLTSRPDHKAGLTIRSSRGVVGKAASALIIGLSGFSPIAMAQTTGVRVETHTNGTLKVIQVPSAQFAQTTGDNCGAAAANVITYSEVYKRKAAGASFDEAALKKYLDSDASGGINKGEMADGLGKIGGILNTHFAFTGNRAISTTWTANGQPTTGTLSASLAEVKQAIGTAQFWMLRSYSCVPIQGNVDGFWSGIFGRGDHWYVIHASGNADSSTPWIAVLDGVYKSAAFPNLQNVAIPPTRILYASAVQDIWKPTGPNGGRTLAYVASSKRR